MKKNTEQEKARGQRLRVETALRQAKDGMFLTIRDLALATGFPRARIGKLAKQPGFPLMEKRVTMADFKSWLRKREREKSLRQMPLSQPAISPAPYRGSTALPFVRPPRKQKALASREKR